jgi:hypothetical protein
MNRDPLRKVSL